MFLSRRRQRRLLLPPGWVALGFTLLLGCLVLLSHERQMRLPTVMQLTMPPLKPEESTPWLTKTPIYRLVATLDLLRLWHDVDFVGAPLNDFANAEIAKTAMRAMITDSSHEGGVRIRFRQQATYANLIKALDLMNVFNQKKYWLDIRHKPITLYAITEKQLPLKEPCDSREIFMCGGVFVEKLAPKLTFQQLLNELRQKASSLSQQNWRPSMLLLALISSLSICRLGNLRRASR
jgi:hypothetical protein